MNDDGSPAPSACQGFRDGAGVAAPAAMSTARRTRAAVSATMVRPAPGTRLARSCQVQLRWKTTNSQAPKLPAGYAKESRRSSSQTGRSGGRSYIQQVRDHHRRFIPGTGCPKLISRDMAQ